MGLELAVADERSARDFRQLVVTWMGQSGICALARQTSDDAEAFAGALAFSPPRKFSWDRDGAEMVVRCGATVLWREPLASEDPRPFEAAARRLRER